MFSTSEIHAHYSALTGSVCELPKDRDRRYSEFGIYQRAVYVQRGAFQLLLPFWG